MEITTTGAQSIFFDLTDFNIYNRDKTMMDFDKIQLKNNSILDFILNFYRNSCKTIGASIARSAIENSI